MNKIFSVIFFFFILLTENAAQQNFQFFIHLGNFLNPVSSDFSKISHLGFLHATKTDATHSDVFLIGFDDREKAEESLANLKRLGYTKSDLYENVPQVRGHIEQGGEERYAGDGQPACKALEAGDHASRLKHQGKVAGFFPGDGPNKSPDARRRDAGIQQSQISRKLNDQGPEAQLGQYTCIS